MYFICEINVYSSRVFSFKHDLILSYILMIFPLFVAVDEYIAIAKEKHGYNMEQVKWLLLKRC